ncbi:MAG: hypothetical protein EA352_04225, partial [Gemmatimonadales bacterium]
MTDSPFRERFQLLDCIADGPVRSHQALAHTGVVVMVHLLPSGEAGQDRMAQVEALRNDPQGRILEVTEDEGRPVVVTKFILDFESFDAWLRQVGAGSAGGTPPAEAGPAGRDLGGDAATQGSAGGVGAVGSQGPPEEDGQDGGDEDGPGEFTRMFRAVDPPPEAASTRADEPPQPHEGPPPPDPT